MGNLGSQYAKNRAFNFVFERDVNMNSGENQISLLSVTVGLKNYGAKYELMPAGIVGGPVQLIGNITMDLSNNMWSYKIGLHGEEHQIQLANPKHKWFTGIFPTMRPFTWYQTTFQTPLGSEAVVVDLLGMGKGSAWVNGQSIRRFWPNYTTDANGCGPCDHRGKYYDSKCHTGCGEPAQRWYHVPRSFLKEGDLNTLTPFEEAGGHPSQVNFKTVTVGTACAHVAEGKTLALSCQGGRAISNIEFASFGNPNGTCGSFKVGACQAQGALSAVQEACLGKKSCSIEVSENLLGAAKCDGVETRRLAVQATC